MIKEYNSSENYGELQKRSNLQWNESTNNEVTMNQRRITVNKWILQQ